VSNAKRYRDGKGRAFCVACAKAERTKHSTIEPAAPIPPKPVIIAPSRSNDPLIELDAPSVVAPVKKPCPECSVPISVDARLCIHCGYDTMTGRVATSEAPIGASRSERTKARTKGKPCVSCGYDLKGLKSPRCPECGTVNSGRAVARANDRAELRRMYIRPLIGAAIGLACALALATAIRGIPGLVGYGLYIPASIVVTFLTYFFCSVAFIGFDEPIGVTFVRVACVICIYSNFSILMDQIPFGSGLIGTVIRGAIFIGLLVKIMDIDLEDAKLVVLAVFLVNGALFIGFLWLMG
jgi:predicted RNA-binding Zn-ribbon protein involved in translation (DUF1610 family)